MILDIDDYIYKELDNYAPLTAVIGTRLEKFFGELDIVKPYITFAAISPGNYQTKISQNTQSYQFLIVGDTNAVVKEIKSIIFDKLNNFGGLLGDYPAGTGVTVMQSTLISETPIYDKERRIYRLSNEYQFLYYRK